MPTPPDPPPARKNRFEDSAIVDLLGRLARMQAPAPASVESDGTQPAAQLMRAAPALLWELGEFVVARVNQASGLGGIIDGVGRAQSGSAGTSGANGRSYEETRRRFSELELKLREQTGAIEHLVGLSQSDSKVLHALHHTLVLACPQGGKTRGQFRCLNKTGRETSVDMRVRALHGEAGTLSAASLTCQPNETRLAPAEAALFTIDADFSGCPELSNETLRTSVDVYLNAELTLRLFVSVAVQAGTTTAAATEENAATIELHDIDATTLRVLQSIQRLLLKHPVAFQAAYSALIIEGEQFATTPEGQILKARLERSPLVQQLRYVFDLTTFSLLEREEPETLPSAYIDTLFMLASNHRSDDILDRLFRAMTP
jgi:hypothetical protein